MGYALLGFLIVPALVKHFGQKYLQENFSEASAIAAVKMNPFRASVRVEGLFVTDADNTWSAAWESAELNLSAASLLRFYPVVNELRLVGADLRYEKRATDSAVDDVVSPAEDGAGSDWRTLVGELNLLDIPKLRVDLLEVEAGRFEFVDLTAAGTFKKTVDPINFTLRDLTTVIEGTSDTSMRFLAETDGGGRLSWEGDLMSQPIRSTGHFSLSGLAIHDLSPYFAERIRFDLKRAVYALEFDYELDFSDLEHLLRIRHGQMALTDVLAEPLEGEHRLISVDSVLLDGIDFQFPAMALKVSQVTIEDGATRVFRDADGQINLAQLIAVRESPAETLAAAPQREDSLPALSYRIDQISLVNYHIIWEDVLAAGMANLTVEIPQMQLRDVSSDLQAPFRIEADYRVGDSGTARIEGSVAPAGPEVDIALQVQSLPLQMLSLYAEEFAATVLEAGTFDFEGRLQYASAGGQSLSGNAALMGVALKYDADAGANWSRLGLQGIQLELSPLALRLESVKMDQPEFFFTLTAASESAEVAGQSDTPDQSEAASSRPATPVRVDSVEVAGGRFTFKDARLESAPEIRIDRLDLSLIGLDLAGSEPAQLKLDTRINGSRLQAEGDIDLNQIKETTRLKASLEGLSLPAFSAYSGQAVGRGIGSGLFNLEADWQIEASQLRASNRMRIEDFTLGERVESDNATRLPLDLAVTLLKGPSGVMDLSLPLSGDLSDPRIGLGQIIRTALFGLITNVASSPFRMLAGLAGGSADEDLSFVSFEPGSAELGTAMVSRLNTLAAALKERPGIQLSMTAQISADDWSSLLEKELRLDVLAGADPEDEALFHRSLTQRYRAFMRDAGTPDRETSAEDEAGLRTMVEALLPGIELSSEERARLASARTAVIREHLVAAQGVDTERLSVDEAELDASDSVVKFDLK
ncbi:MAG: DUF748 domain-containing protein [Puniceicoccaceae bacterium]|nr:MAG: DUF748 domain-containing protein [Puniceicoccaceae bacterium]